ncbi:MAG TPA: hypothetical protein VIP70_09465 [Nitrososphaeraceae archaeon]
MKQIKAQKADVVNAITTASAQPSKLRSVSPSSKSEMQPNVIRVFHEIYSTKEG